MKGSPLLSKTTAVLMLALFCNAIVAAGQVPAPIPMMGAGTCNRPVIILKADDLGEVSASWQAYFDIIEEFGICTSVGVISGNVTTPGSIATIQQMNSETYVNAMNDVVHRFEFWNHSSEHVGFANLSLTDQYNNLTACQNFFHNSLGFESHAFGPPGNSMNDNTALALNQYDAAYNDILTIWMGTGFPTNRPSWRILDSFAYGQDNNHIILGNNYNDTDSSLLSDEFINNYNAGDYNQKPFIQLQIHPAAYDAASIAELRDIITFLKEKNALFVTPSYLYDKANIARYCGDYYSVVNVSAVNSLAAGYSGRYVCGTTTAECDHTIVHNGANVAFNAQKRIYLKPGFTAQPGGTFHAWIGGGSGGRQKSQDAVVSARETVSIESKSTSYPNPNNGTFTVDLGNPQNVSTIKVFDLRGREIKTITSKSPMETIDISNEPNGTYIVRVSTNRGVNTFKIVKK